MGTHAADALVELGVLITDLADETGSIHADRGLDLGAVRIHVAEAGGLKGFTDADELTAEEFFARQVDLLIPAAIENQITSDNVETIRARTVVEAANGPVTADASAVLEDGGVEVIPDILANAGGVIVSYYEWVQNKTSDHWTGEQVEQRLRDRIWEACDRVSARHLSTGVSRRSAAYIEATELIARVYEMRGIFP